MVDMDTHEARTAGLLEADLGALISHRAVFRPHDHSGHPRTIVVNDCAEVGAFAVVHGGAQIGPEARVEDLVVLGQPELGYALRAEHPGHGARTVVEVGAVLRAGAIVYAGARIGERTVIGHHSVLRTDVHLGKDCTLGHLLTVERGARIGDRVRISPGTHLTADTVVCDDVFLGAGVRTINDNGLDWTVGGGELPMTPPRFEDGARVGSGAVILGGITIGAGALVGAGAVVLDDVAADTVVVGNPARALPSRSAS